MKSAKFSKRLIAYIIDILVFAVIIFICTFFIKDSKNVAILNLELNSINEMVINHDITLGTYINRYAFVMHELDREKAIINVINCAFILGYFVFIPYMLDGKTLGKKLMKIKVVRKDLELLSINDLLIRNLIINGLGFMLISLCLLYITPSLIYFIVSTILAIFQILLVIISASMIIYRKDKRGIHDILSDTYVVIDK